MANYITSVNKLIADAAAAIPNVVLFGENINTGSHICGMTRNLRFDRGGRIINIGNCESTHCGMGMGLMLNSVSSILFCKQLDFIVLGVDHLISTYSAIRASRDLGTLGSFTICVIVCDQGYQGPQSSFNALGDLCSLARVPGYTLTNQQDASWVLARQLQAPGFRFVALSQRLFPSEWLTPSVVWAADDGSVFQYSDGQDAAIACFNFSLPMGLSLQQRLSAEGLDASVFSVNQVMPPQWGRILAAAARSQRLVIMDDSKSDNLLAHRLGFEAATAVPGLHCILVSRGDHVDPGVCDDQLSVDYDALISQLRDGAQPERLEVGSGESA